MKQIPLRRRDGTVRAYALVDDSDFEGVSRYRWHLANGYVARDAPRPHRVKILLHRELLGLAADDHREVDHRDRNPLNCCRSNLRVATRSLNGQNLPAQRDARSRFRGVTWDRKLGRWRAQVMLRRRNHFLGTFDSETDAAWAAQAFRDEHMPFALPDPELARAA